MFGNFDPLTELDRQKQLEDKNLDALQRKSVWKMNYKMKNELEARTKT